MADIELERIRETMPAIYGLLVSLPPAHSSWRQSHKDQWLKALALTLDMTHEIEPERPALQHSGSITEGRDA